jgi:Holliday junction resolvase RusA-like endonuclease
MMNKCGLIDYDVNVAMEFYFPAKTYWTKQGKRSNKVPDLSNAFEAVSDGLQKVGILASDALINGFDGSFRAAIDSDVHKLKIIITKI